MNYNYPSQAASLYKPKLELDQAALSMNMWAAATASHAIQAEYTGQQPPIPNPYSFLPSATPSQQAAVLVVAHHGMLVANNDFFY